MFDTKYVNKHAACLATAPVWIGGREIESDVVDEVLQIALKPQLA
jgi:hypothetical protein